MISDTVQALNSRSHAPVRFHQIKLCLLSFGSLCKYGLLVDRNRHVSECQLHEDSNSVPVWWKTSGKREEGFRDLGSRVRCTRCRPAPLWGKFKRKGDLFQTIQLRSQEADSPANESSKPRNGCTDEFAQDPSLEIMPQLRCRDIQI